MGILITYTLCPSRWFAPEDANLHWLLLCLEEHVCVCLTETFVPSMGQPRSDLILVLVSKAWSRCHPVTEAFVPSMGQPRSDEQWWEDLGADTHCGLTMMVGGGRWASSVGGSVR